MIWQQIGQHGKQNTGYTGLDQKSDCLLVPGEKYEWSCSSQVRCWVWWFYLIQEIHLFWSPSLPSSSVEGEMNIEIQYYVTGKELLIWLSQTVQLKSKIQVQPFDKITLVSLLTATYVCLSSKGRSVQILIYMRGGLGLIASDYSEKYRVTLCTNKIITIL